MKFSGLHNESKISYKRSGVIIMNLTIKSSGGRLFDYFRKTGEKDETVSRIMFLTGTHH